METHNRFGHQIVEVDNGRAYTWSKKTPLKVGDRVRLPGKMWETPPQGVVTRLGSDQDTRMMLGINSRVLS